MKELQRAAKLLNANAPVDGPFGKERIVYVNPFEERILKELGGSGEIIIPEEGTPSYSQYKGPTQSRVLPEGYEGVTSFRVPMPNATPKKSYNWLETVFDDWLGFDDTKWLGIKKDTFIGKGLKKIGDDILGIDGKKTLGIKNSTLGDVAKFVAPFFGLPGWAAWAGMNAIEINEALEDAGKFKNDLVKFGDDFKTNYDPRNYIGLRYSNFSDVLPTLKDGEQEGGGEQKLTKEDRAKARGGSANMENIQNRINAVPSYSLTLNDADMATNKAIVTAQQGAGKAPIFNPADTNKVNSFFAEPGDENYIEDFSKGGTYNDPYPDYMKEAGDTIMGEIDEAGKFFKDYQGTADQRMYDFQPIVDKLKGMNLDLINTTGQIFDQGEGGLESKLRGFNSKQDNLANQLKELNTLTGQDNHFVVRYDPVHTVNNQAIAYKCKDTGNIQPLAGWSLLEHVEEVEPGKQSDLIEVVKLEESKVTKARIAFMAPWLEEMGLSIGDVVGIKRDMDYKITIDDKPYYRVRAEDLLYVEEEVHND